MSRRQGYRALAIATLILWAGVLAWHARREYLRPVTARLAEASASLSPTASFYSIRLGGDPIGYAASRIDTVPEGFLLDDDMRLHVRALGSAVPATARTQVRLGHALELRDFQFALRSDFGSFRAEGTMTSDSLLEIRMEAGADEESLRIETDGPVLLPQVMPVHFVLVGGPEAGESITYEVFDPSVMERQRVTVEVLGRETLLVPDSAAYDAEEGRWVPARYDTVDAWHVRQSVGGLDLEAWLDLDGIVVRATSPLGYSIERTAFEIAWNEYRALETEGPAAVGVPDIVERTAISVGAALPRGSATRRLAVRLRDVDLRGFDLDGSRQRLKGDTLFVRADDAPSAAYVLPAKREEWRAELMPTPLVQANDPAVRAAALAAAGGTKDPRLAAERLGEWVYETLEKEVTLSVPSARQVLEAGQGDCNEHTVLYVAMARALGLPARSAAGLVYVRDRFYYHAWPEVWLGEWVPVDPTLGQFPADASHLRFVVGGLARQVELVRLIGKLRLDVVSVEEK